jgi:hypothetical protein
LDEARIETLHFALVLAGETTMRFENYARPGRIAAVVLALCVAANSAKAAIISEGSGATLRYGYGATAGGIDANTAHLWHFDEAAAPFGDSTTIVGNGVSLPSINGTSQVGSILEVGGGAVNKARNFTATSHRISIGVATDTTDNMTGPQYNSFFGPNGQTSVDFLIRPNFAPSATPTVGTAGMRIMASEGNDGTEPHWISVRWNPDNASGGGAPANKLVFELVPGSVTVDIPLSGTNGFTAANQWFHVAFVYDGNEGASNNLKFYWTRVDGPDTALALATSEANLVATTTFGAVGDPFLVTTEPAGPELTFGNRPTGSRAFSGAIDQMRISNVERGAGEFIFVPEPSSFVLCWLAGIAAFRWTRLRRSCPST